MQDNAIVEKAVSGPIMFLTSETPFYAESGGQAGDKGHASFANGAKITIKDDYKRKYHSPKFTSGKRVVYNRSNLVSIGSRSPDCESQASHTTPKVDYSWVIKPADPAAKSPVNSPQGSKQNLSSLGKLRKLTMAKSYLDNKQNTAKSKARKKTINTIGSKKKGNSNKQPFYQQKYYADYKDEEWGNPYQAKTGKKYSNKKTTNLSLIRPMTARAYKNTRDNSTKKPTTSRNLNQIFRRSTLSPGFEPVSCFSANKKNAKKLNKYLQQSFQQQKSFRSPVKQKKHIASYIDKSYQNENPLSSRKSAYNNSVISSSMLLDKLPEFGNLTFN